MKRFTRVISILNQSQVRDTSVVEKDPGRIYAKNTSKAIGNISNAGSLYWFRTNQGALRASFFSKKG
jgi:hypothetical protein